MSSPRPGHCFSSAHSSLQSHLSWSPVGWRWGTAPRGGGAWWPHGSPVAADELGSGRVVVQARFPRGGWPHWVTMETTEVVMGKW